MLTFKLSRPHCHTHLHTVPQLAGVCGWGLAASPIVVPYLPHGAAMGQPIARTAPIGAGDASHLAWPHHMQHPMHTEQHRAMVAVGLNVWGVTVS